MTGEIPVKKDSEFKLIGVAPSENQAFWNKEDEICFLWFKVINVFLLLTCLILNVQMFFVLFDVNIVLYILVETVNILHISFAIFYYLHAIYTINFFFVGQLMFFKKKFAFIGQQVAQIHRNGLNFGKINNRKLGQLIKDLNLIQLELLSTNDFYSNFMGTNLVHFMGIVVLTAFVAISGDYQRRHFSETKSIYVSSTLFCS